MRRFILKLGPLSGVVKEALLSAFDLARESTSMESCRLVIDEVPILAYCERCQDKRRVDSMQLFCCCVCESPVSEILQGKELQVYALEISP